MSPRQGTALLKYLCDYLWSVDRLRIRVHPARGLEIPEDQADDYQRKLQQYSEAELDAIDREQEEEIQKSDFWKKQQQTAKTDSSEDLIKWYQKRGFTISDPDSKHLWRLPL